MKEEVKVFMLSLQCHNSFSKLQQTLYITEEDKERGLIVFGLFKGHLKM